MQSNNYEDTVTKIIIEIENGCMMEYNMEEIDKKDSRH
jgi:hypothetical protein